MSGISKIKDVARRMGLVTALPGQVPVVGRVQSRMFPALSVSGSYALATDIPTVTVGAAGATSAIESAVHVYPAVRNGVYADHLNDPFFRFVGVPEGKMLVSSPGTVEGDRFTGASAGGGTAYWQPYVETAWTGTKFEWHLRAKATGTVYYKLWCDGQPVTDVFQTISAVSGGAYKILQTFPGARSHVVGIEYSGAQFGGAWIEPTASIMRPKIERPKLAVLSNSITGGFASVTRHGTWVGNAARLLGMDIYNASIGQTGFLAVTPYASRVTDIAACQPNLVIVGDPYNDIGQGQAETLAAARQTLDAVLSQCPGARVILLGCWAPSQAPSASILAYDADQAALAAEYGIPFLSYRDAHDSMASTAAWASGATYIVGQCVASGGVVWQCTTAHTAGGSFDMTKFQSCSLVTDANAASVTIDPGGPRHPNEIMAKGLGAIMARRIVQVA